MGKHDIYDELNENVELPATGKIIKPQAQTVLTPRHLIRWGKGAPTGVPDAVMYIDLDATTTTTVVFFDINGVWTALTVA